MEEIQHNNKAIARKYDSAVYRFSWKCSTHIFCNNAWPMFVNLHPLLYYLMYKLHRLCNKDIFMALYAEWDRVNGYDETPKKV